MGRLIRMPTARRVDTSVTAASSTVRPAPVRQLSQPTPVYVHMFVPISPDLSTRRGAVIHIGDECCAGEPGLVTGRHSQPAPAPSWHMTSPAATRARAGQSDQR